MGAGSEAPSPCLNGYLEPRWLTISSVAMLLGSDSRCSYSQKSASSVCVSNSAGKERCADEGGVCAQVGTGAGVRIGGPYQPRPIVLGLLIHAGLLRRCGGGGAATNFWG